MKPPTPTISDLIAEVAALREELSLVPQVADHRRQKELADAQRRDRELLALPVNDRNIALAQRPDLAHFLRGLGVASVRLVVEAPEELREAWAAMLAPVHRHRVALEFARKAGKVTHHVWVTTAPGITMRFPNVEISKQHADALVAVGLGDSVSYRQRSGKSNEWFFDPPSVGSVRTRLTADQLAAVRTAVPDFDAAIFAGHLVVSDHTADEDDAVFLKARERGDSSS